MKKILALLVTASCYSFGCILGSFAQGVDQHGFQTVSLVQLLANPKKFDGKKVYVVGFYESSDFEDSSLYLTRDHARIRDRASSIWIGAYADNRVIEEREFEERKRKYVKIAGIFYAGPAGHLGLWPGEVSKILSVAILKEEGGNK